MSTFAEPPSSRGGVPIGLPASIMQRALHDLRGPLNTLSIVHEILRSTTPPPPPGRPDSLATAARAVRDLGAMLDRLKGVVTTSPPRLQPVRLDPLLAAALGKVARDGLTCRGSSGGEFTVLACPERLPPLLDELFACAAAALPEGGELQHELANGDDDVALAIVCAGPRVALPLTNQIGKLDAAPPAGADWFQLACRCAGLAASLSVEPAATPTRLTVRLQRA